ncbi:MAG TPA: energy-coupling factor transporter transmembrane component T, partial [Ktedonobacteraceae bacterium]
MHLPEKKHKRLSWLEQTISGITSSIEQAVFTEEHARKQGWLQGTDPRAKLGMFLALVLAASLSHTLSMLIVLYLVILAAATASHLPLDFLLKRVWMGIPLFAGIVILPSIFLTPGRPLLGFLLGPLHVAITLPGIIGAVIFVARVGVCVS